MTEEGRKGRREGVKMGGRGKERREEDRREKIGRRERV